MEQDFHDKYIYRTRFLLHEMINEKASDEENNKTLQGMLIPIMASLLYLSRGNKGFFKKAIANSSVMAFKEFNQFYEDMKEKYGENFAKGIKRCEE